MSISYNWIHIYLCPSSSFRSLEGRLLDRFESKPMLFVEMLNLRNWTLRRFQKVLGLDAYLVTTGCTCTWRLERVGC